jgi:crotonobetainyl-CoA:carnitine CoA-transferase CaiB-like acyl-CoA transferase
VVVGQTASGNPHATYAQLIRNADVIVDDFSPGSERQKLVNADWLSALNARLIHCSITAYGKHGPMKDEPPIDDLVMAWAGILSTSTFWTIPSSSEMTPPRNLEFSTSTPED